MTYGGGILPLQVRAERPQELISVSTLLSIAPCEFPNRVRQYFRGHRVGV